MKLDTLERLFPWIGWRKPVHIVYTDGNEYWGCRICIASYGLKGRDVHNLWRTPEEVLDHLRVFHQD